MKALLETLISPGSFDIIINIGFIFGKIVIVVSVVMLAVALAPYFERKVIGHMQVRMGPMRVGPHGILQPIADALKLFFKEDIIPAESDKVIFFIAPVITMFGAMTSLAVIPWWKSFAVADINIGILFIFAMSSVGAYGIVMAGWASNSKFSFLGGLRASAQIISYEVAMGMSLVGVMLLSGSLNLSEIAAAQAGEGLFFFKNWYIFPQIIAAGVFFLSMLAETNRTPFDMPEAESELVAGYFTEYSGFRFSLFFVGEYIAMFVMAAIGVICFLGGWSGPGPSIVPLQLLWFVLKLCFVMFLFFWIRATVPRYRYDQLMAIGWKVLIPLALLNIVITATLKII
ncbi:MAG: NADH-quinone oxidoreductase subunit NuoH [Thermodesulfovibrionales bacterium]|nr:NADH-quinone oxidoreductase subunit NuoH [Thermodesulfovibrionales bacterium]